MHDQKQAKRILLELMRYFWDNHIYQVNVSLKPQKDGYEIELSGFCSQRPDGLDDFVKSLQAGRQPEMDEYYDQLLGIDDENDEGYHLLGAVIDEADITYKQQTLRVKVMRKE